MQHIPKKWANVRGIFLKTADSVALPLFQALPERGAKIEAEGTAVVVDAPAAAAVKATKAAAAPTGATKGNSGGVKKPALKGGKSGGVKRKA